MPRPKWEKYWSKFKSTHNMVIFCASICIFLLSISFLFLSVSLNWHATSLSQETHIIPDSQIVTNQTENKYLPIIGEEYFEMPNTLDNNTYWTVKIAYTLYVSNGTLAQNSIISNFTFNIEFEPPLLNCLRINSIEVKPLDMMYAYITLDRQIGYVYSGFYPVDVYLSKTTGTDTSSKQIWSQYSLQTSVFQNSGPVVFKLTIDAYPQEAYLNKTNWQTFQSQYEPYFTKAVSIQNLNVRSTESIMQQGNAQQQIAILQALNNTQTMMNKQQAIYDLKTQSLTFFVLFFAALDIFVVLFDHSKDEDSQAEYNRKKAEEEERKKFQQDMEIVLFNISPLKDPQCNSGIRGVQCGISSLFAKYLRKASSITRVILRCLVSDVFCI